jgi:replicative DNA helicase
MNRDEPPFDESLAQLRVPPHSAEAEQAVLGGLLLDNGGWDRVGDLVTHADFYAFGHRLVFAAIGDLINSSRTADVITVGDKLGDKLRDVGGLPYLNAMAQSTPSASGIRGYATIVREKAILRKIIAASDEAAALAWKQDGDVGQTLDKIAASFSAIERGTQTSEPVGIADLMVKAVDRISETHERGRPDGWPTGIAQLDRRLSGGFRPGLLYVLAARPKVGKSSLALWFALRMASQQLPTLVLSQEMPSAEVTDRAIASLGVIDYENLQRAELSDFDWSALTDAVTRGSELPLWVDDQPALTIGDIRAKARAVKGLKVLFVDYLQLCAGTDNDDTRNSQIEVITRGLKALAKQMGAAIVVLSQLNRDVEKRATKRPNLADLRDSGAIEQDADAVMFLWPVRTFEAYSIVGCDVAAVRQGKPGAFALEFRGATQRWSESEASIEPLTTAERRGAKGFE